MVGVDDARIWMPEPDRTQWTRQPGNDGVFAHVAVVGSGPTTARPVAPAPAEMRATAPLSKFPLYGFQEDCIQVLEDGYRESRCRAPLIVLPTGSGKTLVSSVLMQRSLSWPFRAYQSGPRSGALFIAHRMELLDQTVEKIRLVADSVRVGVVQGDRDDMGRDITVASMSTLASAKRLAAVIANGPYHLIVIDEAHHAVSTQWHRVINELRAAFPEARLLGMTATPGRADGTALDSVFDSVAYSKTVEWMVNHGYLVPPRGLFVPLDIDLDKIESKDGDFVQAQLSAVINTEPVRVATVRAWQRYGNDAKMLVFCVDVKHAQDLAATFIQEGYPAVAVSGKSTKTARAKALADFRSGAVRLLCSADLLSEGYDDPSAEGVLLARPTQSQALYVQQVGRGLRKFPMKTECLVLDCVGNTTRHRLAQLATIAGYDPERKLVGESSATLPPWMLPPEEPAATVSDARTGLAREVQLTGRMQETKHRWLQSSAGFALRIPKVGYYLVLTDVDDTTKSHIRFFDRRKGREHVTVNVMGPIATEMAYTLVEADLDRLRRSVDQPPQYGGRTERDLEEMTSEALPTGLVDFGEDGIDFVPDAFVLRDQDWHKNPVTPKQQALLRRLGVKEKSMPETSGEAAELIDVLHLERDIRGSQPATTKQLWYLRAHQVVIPRGATLDTLTKAQATRLVVAHKLEADRPKERPRAGNDDDSTPSLPFNTEDDA